MGYPTIIKPQYFWGDWLQTLIAVVSAVVFSLIQIIGSNGVLLKKFCRTCFCARRMLAAGQIILFHASCALALPKSPNHSSTDIAVKSYNLNHKSFNVMVVMGVVMIVVSLIQLAITIAKSWPRRKHHDLIPRHPPNCVAFAEAHEALKWPGGTGSSHPASPPVELSPVSSKMIAKKRKRVKAYQKVAPMPRARLAR
ncbi:hypothetical protein F5Y08DRAFT_323998, partial [Xylaria arbuscula]